MHPRYPFFKGMTPILPTVIDNNGEPDLDAQGRLVEYVLECGAVAIGHMAGASEYYKVSEYDRKPILRALCAQVNGRVPIFIGTTDIARKTAILQAEQAAELGANLIMVCSPILGAMQKEDLLQYYVDVGQASTLPIILQDTGASSSLYNEDFIFEVCDRVPTVGYVKSEGVNCLPKTKALVERLGNEIQVIGGSGGYGMLTLLRLGITAFMTGTECTDVHNDCINAFFSGDIELSEKLFYTTILSYLYFFSQNSRYFLKYMLKRRGLLDTVHLPFPAEGSLPDPFIVSEFDLVLDAINSIRGKVRL